MDFLQLRDDHRAQFFIAGENFLQLRDARLDFLQLLENLLALHLREAMELQIQNCLRLAVGESGGCAAACVLVWLMRPANVHGHQCFFGFLGRFAAANELDDFVEMIESDLEADQDVLALFGFAQIVLRSAAHHFDAVLDEKLDQLDQSELARLARDDGEQDHAERFLHLRLLEEMIQDELRLFVALHFDDDAHAVAIGFVANVADALNFLVLHQIGDVSDKPRFVHLIGQFRDDDVLAIFTSLLDGGFGAHLESAATGFVSLLDSIAPVDVAARGEIRAGDKLHHFLQIGFGLLDQHHGRFDNFRQIVRRNIRWPCLRRCRGTVDEQVGNSRRQNGRFATCFHRN